MPFGWWPLRESNLGFGERGKIPRSAIELRNRIAPPPFPEWMCRLTSTPFRGAASYGRGLYKVRRKRPAEKAGWRAEPDSNHAASCRAAGVLPKALSTRIAATRAAYCQLLGILYRFTRTYTGPDIPCSVCFLPSY